jgi:DNA polymerase elongation subunit (family B)
LKFYTNVQQWGNNILVRGVGEDGQRIMQRYKDFSPTLYLKSHKPTTWKTIEGTYVEPFQPGSVKESREFLEQYRDVENFKIYGQTQYLYQWISDNFVEKDEIEFDTKQISILSLDIETSTEYGFPNIQTANEQILLITVRDSLTQKLTTWGLKEYHGDNKEVDYRYFMNETTMLNDFIAFIQEYKPDVITGWNSRFFDIPYIVNRIERLLGEEKTRFLSPWKIVKGSKVTVQGREQQYYDIFGIAGIDYLELFRKYRGIGYESFALGHIANVELGAEKLDHSEYENFKDFYDKDWNKFVDYNIRDVELVAQLEDKLGLIDLQLTMAYDFRVNYEDVFSQVRCWDMLIYNTLRKKGIVIPPKKSFSKSEAYAGAYVKEPTVGQHDWVVSFDLNSLYPHLIMQYNISPDTVVDERIQCTVDELLGQKLDTSHLKDRKLCMSANGQCFRTDFQGFLPAMMEELYESRKFYKKKMLEAEQEYEITKKASLKNDIARYGNIQLAKKIALNSAYGALGNQYFRYFDIRQAEGITLSGQLSIRWIETALNKYFNKLLKTEDENYVIASDTDSVYINLSKLVDEVYGERARLEESAGGVSKASIVKFLDRVASEKLEPFIDKSYQDLANYMNAYAQKMFMKREVIADRGIWTAKKRYILNVHNSEGVQYDEPKLKIMGLEVVKSSTPAPVRLMLKDAIKVIVNGSNDDLLAFIENAREEFNALPPEEIAFPRSVNGVEKYKSDIKVYTKGTPMHVRGALMFNELVKRKKITNRYPAIKDGEKIKFIHCKMPNPIGENIISFLSTLPTEFDMHKYIDYDMQFEKAFLDPLRFIAESINWQLEKVATLEDFFG